MKKNMVAEDLKIPNWPELAVRKIWVYALKFDEFKRRVPDEWDGGLRTDRTFFWTILFSVSEEFV